MDPHTNYYFTQGPHLCLTFQHGNRSIFFVVLVCCLILHKISSYHLHYHVILCDHTLFQSLLNNVYYIQNFARVSHVPRTLLKRQRSNQSINARNHLQLYFNWFSVEIKRSWSINTIFNKESDELDFVAYLRLHLILFLFSVFWYHALSLLIEYSSK